jgi:hypothetical protein
MASEGRLEGDNDADEGAVVPVVVAEYGTYPEATDSVGRLIAEGVDESKVSIVWSRLRQVEPGTARRFRARAVLVGAIGGAIAGGTTAILLSVFVVLEEGISPVMLVGTWSLAFAALGGAALFAWQHVRGGRPDLADAVELAAESYQVTVDDDVADVAIRRLGTAPAPAPEAAADIDIVADEPAAPEHQTAASLLAAPPPAPRT